MTFLFVNQIIIIYIVRVKDRNILKIHNNKSNFLPSKDPQLHFLIISFHPFPFLQTPNIQLQYINFLAQNRPNIRHSSIHISMHKLLNIRTYIIKSFDTCTSPDLQNRTEPSRRMKDHLMYNLIPVHECPTMKNTNRSFLKNCKIMQFLQFYFILFCKLLQTFYVTYVMFYLLYLGLFQLFAYVVGVCLFEGVYFG